MQGDMKGKDVGDKGGQEIVKLILIKPVKV